MPKPEDRIDKHFKQLIYAYVAGIPIGRVMTYGQLAALAGAPYAARLVGGVAHWGDPDLPWQRVVMKDGGLATGYPGGTEGHAAALVAEGVEVGEDLKVNMAKHLWQPPHKNQAKLDF